MQTVHNKITLDVNTAENKTYLTVAKAEDSASRFIDITLTCAGEKIIVGNNDRAVFMAEDENGNTVSATDCTTSGGIVIAELTRNVLAVPGRLKCEVVVYGTNSAVLTSASFYVMVTARIDSTVVERENDFSALVSALSDVAGTSNRIDEVAETVNTRIQPVSLGGTGAADETAAAQSLKVASLAQTTAISSNEDLNDYTAPGTYNAVNAVAATLTNCPVTTNFKLYVIEQQRTYNIQLLIAATANSIWYRGSTTANTYGAWKQLTTQSDLTAHTIYNYLGSDIGKTDPDETPHTAPEMLFGTDYDELTDTGLYAIRGTNQYPTVNAPNGNNANNMFYVLVMRYNGTFFSQLAFNIRTENDVYIRNHQSGGWSVWKKMLASDNVIAEGGTWNPAAQSGNITVNTARYIYDGKRITVTAKITCGSDIASSLVITGLPITAAYECSACCSVSNSTETLNAVISGNTLTIRSASALAGTTLIITATYII